MCLEASPRWTWTSNVGGGAGITAGAFLVATFLFLAAFFGAGVLLFLFLFFFFPAVGVLVYAFLDFFFLTPAFVVLDLGTEISSMNLIGFCSGLPLWVRVLAMSKYYDE